MEISPLWENLFNRSRAKSLKQSLKENILFQDLDGKELHLMEGIVNLRSFKAGETIFHQGEVGVGMYIIEKGTVVVVAERLSSKNENHSSQMIQERITELKEKDFFGDMALVEAESRRSATVTAVTDCRLIGFFKSDLIEITNRNPIAGVKILWRLSEVLATRLRETTNRAHHNIWVSHL